MQQIQFSEYGTVDVLKLVESTPPMPGTGEVLLQIEAIGVNYSDILRRRNSYFLPTPLPFVPGTEAVGTVISVGDQVGGPAAEIGTRVLAALPDGGGYADQVIAPAHFCIPLPPNIDSVAATAIFVQGSTAWLTLHAIAGELQGKAVLVHAAASGVGSLQVQLAKRAGARVIATASSAEKLAVARALGADAIVNYSETGWPERVIEANDGKVDVVLEMVGGTIYEQSFHCLKQGGRMVVFGAASGQKGFVHSEHFVDMSHSLLSFNLAHFIEQRPAEWQTGLGELIGLLAEEQLQVQTDYRFPLAEAATAHRQMEARKTTGKVVLLP